MLLIKTGFRKVLNLDRAYFDGINYFGKLTKLKGVRFVIALIL